LKIKSCFQVQQGWTAQHMLSRIHALQNGDVSHVPDAQDEVVPAWQAAPIATLQDRVIAGLVAQSTLTTGYHAMDGEGHHALFDAATNCNFSGMGPQVRDQIQK
jgi:hypothetical protein